MYSLTSADDGYNRVEKSAWGKLEIYNFLSTDFKKLDIENWQNINFDPNNKEGLDYVLVGEKIWTMLKKTFNGGPTIQFFMVNDDELGETGATGTKGNYLYQNDYSLYGTPDLRPTYLETSLEILDNSGEEPFKMVIPYKLMVSGKMCIKALLYFVATRLEVDVHLLSLAILMSGEEVEIMKVGNGTMTLNELGAFYPNAIYRIKYSGSTGNVLDNL